MKKIFNLAPKEDLSISSIQETHLKWLRKVKNKKIGKGIQDKWKHEERRFMILLFDEVELRLQKSIKYNERGGIFNAKATIHNEDTKAPK